MTRPRFEDLPLREGDPLWSAWGLYGPHDQLGTRNLLTPERTIETALEIRTGRRIGLDLPIDYLGKPSHGRQGLAHKIIWKAPRSVHDNEVAFNTQISTQWDGLRHLGYYRERLWYNGIKQPQISGTNEDRTTILGIHARAKQGIVGRGVLIDYHRWRLKQERPFDVISAHPITYEELMECAKDQSVELKQGDILFVRSGWRVGYEAMTLEAREKWGSSPQAWVGVETSLKTLKWLWDAGFSACASDSPGWECLEGGKNPNSEKDYDAGWGMPLGKKLIFVCNLDFTDTFLVGEYFDLETLSEECHQQQRYSFFISSMPLCVTGGVASPANTVAIS
ncbi:hypothetical protein N7520_003226 [Penicillium odoratum]|uniref:uncharacterized protein n=1 Tax=Penicillium odoratum TaxID=1167516 RepID=UPI0025496938|nr:uncharacterized protein N7520_003226 [Penicillium odoratum]KAJ5772697.1 hypothetical protein N7520_003226 [Penicillium odoratum]